MNGWSVSRLVAGLICCVAAGTASAQPSSVTGACCTRAADGTNTCQVVTPRACFQAHGRFKGPNTACAADTCTPPPPPPPPTGACCTTADDGAVSCAVQTPADCRTADGRWRGPNSVCDPNPCLPPTGACCTTDDAGVTACAVQTISACRQADGRFKGPNSACEANTCAVPSGACCTRGKGNAFVCAVQSITDCRTARGLFRGNGSVCEPSPCPVPPPARGACCIAATDTAGPRCVILTQAACTTAGGTYGGDNSTCRSANCATTCACDWDHDGFLTVRDLFAFANDYMAGNADFNHSGATDQADLTDFTSCFQSAPDGCVRAGRRGGPN